MVKVVYDEICLSHIQDYGHPERPERIVETLKKIQDFSWVEIVSSEKFSENVLLHDEEYIEYVKTFRGYMTGDTIVRSNTYELALNSVYCALTAVRCKGFSLSRPPGHHAGRNFGGGFCYFNNIAIAAHELTKEGKKVLILDWDLHHGNGTENIVGGRKDIFYISLHQGWIYPGTGNLEDSHDNIIDLPMPSGAGNQTYLDAFDEIIVPAIHHFNPDFILVSHGSDAHWRDPLGSLELTSDAYGVFTQKVCEYTKNIAILLEGGYDLQALAESNLAILKALQGKNVELTKSPSEIKADVAKMKRFLKNRYEFLR
jgi:acetoin utilization deacetylase AcuC-like enzyme